MSCPQCGFNECTCNQKQQDQIRVINSYPEVVGEVPPNAEPIGLNRNFDTYPEDLRPDMEAYKRAKEMVRREKKG